MKGSLPSVEILEILVSLTLTVEAKIVDYSASEVPLIPDNSNTPPTQLASITWVRVTLDVMHPRDGFVVILLITYTVNELIRLNS